MEVYSSDNSDSDEQSAYNSLNFSFSSVDSEKLENLLDLVSHDDVKEKTSMILHYNNLTRVPENISRFMNLRKLDISNNRIHKLPDDITRLPLRTLIAKNNILDEEFLCVKSLEPLIDTLEILNLSGNNISYIPEQILQLSRLKYLFLGQNRIQEIPQDVNRLSRLEILSVGGNQLTSVPSSVGQLFHLRALILSHNQLDSLPASVANLANLRVLQLHKNKLRTLPTEIITLKNLCELSLRDNPLVVKFVSDMVYEPPTLQELAARTIKLYHIPYSVDDLPHNLIQFLDSAHHCLNPQCQGVFFDNRVEHVKFVDFCGKYRLPLLQYLCSSKCRDDTDRQSHVHHHDAMLRKVLLSNLDK